MNKPTLLRRISKHLPVGGNKSTRLLLSLGAVSLSLVGGWFAATLVLGIGAYLGKPVSQVSPNPDEVNGKVTGAKGSEHQPPLTTICEKDGAEMIYVPPGEFVMGANGGYANEKPEHTVFVGGVYVYKYEVTVAQYGEFLRNQEGKGHEPDAPYDTYMPADYFTNPKYSNHPVVNVSWEDAAAYCKWAGNRLLTEAEWEKAARGTDGPTYPWGNAWDGKLSNWDDEVDGFLSDGFRFTAPVGTFPKGVSPFGIHDLAGNVWEWVDAWYQPYEGNVTQDPDYGNTYRVVRGGSWLRYPLGLTASSRDTCAPALRYNSIGFRCGCDNR